jgi:3-dehydro-L-gulonate-6-phosphate decarboxylase
MKIPYLQIALDNTSLEDAFGILKNGLGDEVDIIECGTLLIISEGLKAVRTIRSAYPDKILVADAQLSVAHFGPVVLDTGVQFVTMFSPARNEIKKSIQDYALSHNQEVQIELYGDYGDMWNFDDLKKWKELGIKQIIYGRPSSANGPWTEEDVSFVKKICDMGFEVTATGGITYEDLDILAGLPLYAIICGRSIRNADNPAKEAARIKEKIKELWTK